MLQDGTGDDGIGTACLYSGYWPPWPGGQIASSPTRIRKRMLIEGCALGSLTIIRQCVQEMLQTFKTPTLPYRGAQAPAPGPDYISLEELFKIFTGFLHRQYPVIIAAFLL